MFVECFRPTPIASALAHWTTVLKSTIVRIQEGLEGVKPETVSSVRAGQKVVPKCEEEGVGKDKESSNKYSNSCQIDVLAFEISDVGIVEPDHCLVVKVIQLCVAQCYYRCL